MSDPIYAGWTKRQWAKHDREECNLLAALKHYQEIYGTPKTLELCTGMLEFHDRLRVLKAELAAEQPAIAAERERGQM